MLGLVGGLGFWEVWRLPLVCRELRFGFSGGGAPADMIKLGLTLVTLVLALVVARKPICAGRRACGEQERLNSWVGGAPAAAACKVERR